MKPMSVTEDIMKKEEGCNEGILILGLDKNYHYLFYNTCHKKDMKNAYNASIAVGSSIFNYIPKAEMETLKKSYDIALAGKMFTETVEYGKLIKSYYEITYMPLLGKNESITGILVMAKNVTNIKQLEKRLSLQEEMSHKYFEVTNQILIVLDDHANILLVNQAGCNILEDSKENIIGQNWFKNFIPNDIYAEVMTVFAEVFKTGYDGSAQYTNTIVTSKGNIKTIRWNNTLIKDENGDVKNILSSGEDITKQLEYETNLQKISITDELTGLYNRRYYEQLLIECNELDDLPMTVIILDINGLKLVNDAFGHENGDRFIKETARIINEVAQNIGKTFRIGGDEFAICLPKKSKKDALKMISKINKLASKVSIQGIDLSISSGTETKIDKTDNLKEIVRIAEDRMYRMKLLEIPSMRSGTIDAIVTALYEKDPYSKEHSKNTALYCQRFAQVLGLSDNESKQLYTIGLLHDIGKIVLPNDVINKKGALTDVEYHEVKKHSEVGFRILNSSKNLRDISEIALYHHEWWNGNGYPNGIKGEEIPLLSRILSIADAFDAMTSFRLYREILTVEEACKEILKCSGSQFDPYLTKKFLENIEYIWIKD